MDVTPFVDNLRRELAVAAEAGGADARALAERLTGPLESAARLMLLEALSAAAEEITRDLAPGSVDVRLRGRDPSFVVTPPGEGDAPAVGPADPGAAGTGERQVEPELPPVERGADEGGTARITLRLPEHLKARVEDAAARQGFSVNAWLVRAVSAALTHGTPGAPGGTGEQGGAGGGAGRPGGTERSPQSGRTFTGWVR
ncbi:toxin-antitoxin system HicB family antitoxin [Spirillospora sp. NBC_00431]